MAKKTLKKIMTKKEKLEKLKEAWDDFSCHFDAPEDEDDCIEAVTYRTLEAAISDVCD
jgi:hypothetical protein